MPKTFRRAAPRPDFAQTAFLAFLGGALALYVASHLFMAAFPQSLPADPSPHTTLNP